MTCRQLGGPCDTPFQGNTADEIIKAANTHLNEMAGKDDGHAKAKAMMDERWKNPAGGMEWYNKTKNDFDALPEG